MRPDHFKDIFIFYVPKISNSTGQRKLLSKQDQTIDKEQEIFNFLFVTHILLILSRDYHHPNETVQQGILTVVDVFSEWAGPCNAMQNYLKKIKLEVGLFATMIRDEQ